MAVDQLLLQRYPEPAAVRYRHYEWHRPAFTFGYSQKIAFVRERLPTNEGLEVVRRATGGGLVDHRDDWTYALVIPRAHPLYERPGPTIYQAVHHALAEALMAIGAEVCLQRQPPQLAPGVCFERAELDDIVRLRDSRKVAGAALKRNKHGILLQGSVWRPAAGDLAWDDLDDRLATSLASALDASLAEPGWPTFDPDEEEALTERYASQEWTEKR